MKNLVAFTSGFIFAIGLALSQMTQPQKVVGFLDILGDWDPALAFVMMGAIGVHGLLYPLIVRRREQPVLVQQFHVPERRDLPPSLFLGAALFGIGWGLAGYCPGPALVVAASGAGDALFFVGFMLLGMFGFKLVEPKLKKITGS